MADKNIKIAIQTTADTAGARAAEEALKGVAEAGREAAQAEPQGFGRDTAAARRIAEIEQAEAVEKHAEAIKQVATAAKEASDALPALGEADLVAEGVERLGNAATATAGAAGGGGLAGLGRVLLSIVNPVGLATAAISATVGALLRWKKSLDEWDESAKRGSETLGQLSTAYIENERREAAAAESARELARARKAQADALGLAVLDLGNYAEQLEKVNELEREARRFRDELTDEQTRTALAGAEGDPLAQAQIKDAARVAKQAQEMADLDADILSAKKLEAALWSEIQAALEKKANAAADAAALEDPIEQARKEARDAEILAENLRKQQAEASASAQGKRGSARGYALTQAAQIGEAATRAELAANQKQTELQRLEDQRIDREKTAAAEQKKIEDKERLNQEAFDRRTGLERERGARQQIFGQRDATAGVEMENLRRREQERKEAEQREAERKRLQAERDAARERLTETAMGNRARISGSDVAQGSRGLQGLANEIGRADTTAEINAVKAAVEAKSGELSAAVVQALTAMIAQQEQQVASVRALNERIKRLEAK